MEPLVTINYVLNGSKSLQVSAKNQQWTFVFCLKSALSEVILVWSISIKYVRVYQLSLF